MSKLTDIANRSSSVGIDVAYAALVACGAAFVATALPLNWIPVIGPQAPGIAGGLVGGLFFYRARTNSPLNWTAPTAPAPAARR
jgi:hypothetical protein